MAKISVITSIYNAPEYLERCLRSLLSQKLQDIEYIWIDNGATVECKNILKKYANQNVKLIRFKENIGYLGAIIEGIKNSSSEYIAFCDADDWVHSNYYNELYDRIFSSHSELIICPFAYVYEDESNNRNQLLTFSGITDDYNSALNSISNGSLWNCLFNRQLFDLDFLKNLNGLNSFYTDNILLISSIVKAKRIFLCNDIFYNYCQREKGTIRHLSKKQMSTSCRYIIDVLSSFLEKENVNVTNTIAAFLQRSIPLHTVNFSFLKGTYIFKNNFGILNHIKSCQQYYYPSFLDRMFSVSINKNKTKVRTRILFITFSKKV